MKQATQNFYQNIFGKYLPAIMCGLMFLSTADAANVVPRSSNTTTARPTVGRINTSSTRMPTMTARVQNTQPQTPTEPTPAPTPEPEPAPSETAPEPEPVIIENKSSQFDEILDTSSNSSTDDAATELAEQIRRQRAALDAQSATNTATTKTQNALATGQNACDTGLRTCMREKCGNDFTKCSTDGDTAWGNKMESCRRDLPCTGEEYRMFATEIKADRDMNARLASYNAILDCGNRYNDCIVAQCGATYSKCLGKAAGDAAIAACATIAKNCTQQDSGLAGRLMEVFAALRQDAEKEVQRDEARLYELRDKMATQCRLLGAMFDERSLDCVYTVNFFANNSTTPYASKKAYAGSSFDCTQNWFGVDVTTFKENAFRLTREQTSATSAMLGSGLGTAVGAATSGAIGRAIDRQKAENALKKAEKEEPGDNKNTEPEQENQEPDNSNPSGNPKSKEQEQENQNPNNGNPSGKQDGQGQDNKGNSSDGQNNQDASNGSSDADTILPDDIQSTGNSDPNARSMADASKKNSNHRLT